ncbi:MAG TPA: MBL fold metallo-hydrolase [Methanospirillum sp.]|nr:MBL fold metallo-hydrolase [Methanospirillum sp.]
MKITILVENTTLIDAYYLAEPAFAAWIEDGDTRILFDCGYSDILLRNADIMGIDPLSADTIVFSHGHSDHTWGVIPLLERIARYATFGRSIPRLRFVAHPAAYWSRTTHDIPEVGMLISPDRLSSFGDVTGTTKPIALSDNIIFLGEIPSLFPFDQRQQKGILYTPDGPVPDIVPDDSALVLLTAEGLVILTGCAHAGICSVIERAIAVTGVKKIRDVIGGFHLYQSSPDTISQITCYLNEIQPQELHPCHCTGQLARTMFGEMLTLDETGVGTVLEYL